MTKVKVSGKTKISVKKRKRKYIGGGVDGGFISAKIKASVKKEKAKKE